MNNLFQYVPGNSPLHRMNPITKIVLTIAVSAAAFITDFRGDDIFRTAHISGILQDFRRPVRVGHEHPDDSELGAVIGNQRIHIDPGVRQDLGDSVHGALFVLRENG